MKKIIAAVASVTAIAGLVAPTIASASVQRYQTSDATFTLTQPAGQSASGKASGPTTSRSRATRVTTRSRVRASRPAREDAQREHHRLGRQRHRQLDGES